MESDNKITEREREQGVTHVSLIGIVNVDCIYLIGHFSA